MDLHKSIATKTAVIEVNGITAHLFFGLPAFSDIAEEHSAGAALTNDHLLDCGKAKSSWNILGQATVLWAGYKNYCADHFKRLELSFEHFHALTAEAATDPALQAKINDCFIPFNYAWAGYVNKSFN